MHCLAFGLHVNAGKKAEKNYFFSSPPLHSTQFALQSLITKVKQGADKRQETYVVRFDECIYKSLPDIHKLALI
jgi:hypothetical protein